MCLSLLLMKKVKVVILMMAMAALAACSKRENQTPPVPNPPSTIVMIPQYNHLVRYKQINHHSCLVTCIYMLIHTTKGAKHAIDETHAEYTFDGKVNADKKAVSEFRLATTNGLQHKLLKAAGGLDAHFLNPDELERCINQCEGILKVAPFILGMPGHAVLVVGMDRGSQELIIVNPLNPSTDARIKIDLLRSCSDVFLVP